MNPKHMEILPNLIKQKIRENFITVAYSLFAYNRYENCARMASHYICIQTDNTRHYACRQTNNVQTKNAASTFILLK